MLVPFGPELISLLAREVNARELPARIQKIETGDVWAALKIGGDKWLFFSWHAVHYGLGIVGEEAVSALKKMKTPKTSFGEALKRNFLNGTLLSARQLYSDRIVLWETERLVGAGFTISNFLVFEGMDRNSNLILLDEKQRVQDAAKHIHPDVNRYRTILPGNPYTPPPPLEGDVWSSQKQLRSPDDIRNLLGIGKPLVKTITEHWERFPLSFWSEALDALLSASSTRPVHLQKIGGYLTVFPECFQGGEPLTGAPVDRCGQEAAGKLLSLHREKSLASVRKAIEKESRSRERHADGLRKQIALSEHAGEFKKYGELLLGSAHRIRQGAEAVTVTDWETQREITITLDGKLSPSANAERYFKKYKKGKIDVPAVRKKIEAIEDGILELAEQMDALESIDDPRLLATAAQDILEWLAPQKKTGAKKKKEELPPHIRFSHAGNEIYVGLNARGNRYVTFKAASPGDLWFHIHEIPGAHVVLKTPGETYDDAESSILLAASLAAWFSKARLSTKVQVDFTKRRNVRSISGSAIAHVTYAHPETVQISPDLWKEHPEAVRSIHLATDR